MGLHYELMVLALCLALTSALKVPTSRELLNSHGPSEDASTADHNGTDYYLEQYLADISQLNLLDAKAATSSSSFVQLNDSFCRGPIYITKATETSLNDCQKDCLAKRCTAFSFCDPSADNGCDIHTYPSSTKNASTENFEAGTCILTSGETGTGMLQEAPGWTCGTANSAFYSGSCSGGQGCNIQKETITVFEAKNIKVLKEYPNTPSVDDCCGACKSEEGCNYFVYCRSDSSSCASQVKVSNGNIYPLTDDFEPGKCLVYQARLSQAIKASVVGDNTYDSGFLNTTNGGNGNDAGDGGCSVYKNAFLSGPGTILNIVAAGSADECCAFCKQGGSCNVFQYCHSDAGSCDFNYMSPIDGSTMTYYSHGLPPGSCVLWAVTDLTKIDNWTGSWIPYDSGTL